jgi:hypothetical protein
VVIGSDRASLEEARRLAYVQRWWVPSLAEQHRQPHAYHLSSLVEATNLVTRYLFTSSDYRHLLEPLRQATGRAIHVSDIRSVDVWGLKQGGIGVVYRLAVRVAGRPEPVLLAAILSKDTSFSRERIEREFEIFSRGSRADPRPASERQVLAPYTLGRIRVPGGELAIQIGQWLEGYHESHVDSASNMVIVRSWDEPSTYVHLSPEESQEVWAEFARLKTFYANFRADQATYGFFAINDGPFVIALDDAGKMRRTADGRPDVRITSVSGEVTHPVHYLPLALALEMAVFRPQQSSLNGASFVFWAQPARALDAFVQGVVDRAAAGATETERPDVERAALRDTLTVLDRTAGMSEMEQQQFAQPLGPQAQAIVSRFREVLPVFIADLRDRLARSVEAAAPVDPALRRAVERINAILPSSAAAVTPPVVASWLALAEAADWGGLVNAVRALNVPADVESRIFTTIQQHHLVSEAGAVGRRAGDWSREIARARSGGETLTGSGEVGGGAGTAGVPPGGAYGPAPDDHGDPPRLCVRQRRRRPLQYPR